MQSPQTCHQWLLIKHLKYQLKKLAGEKSLLAGMPCIIIKNNSASEQGQVSLNLTIKDSF